MTKKRDNSVSISVGRKIKEARKSAGMTGEQLGLRLGVTQQQISRYESGRTPITIDILFLLLMNLTSDLKKYYMITFIRLIKMNV